MHIAVMDFIKSVRRELPHKFRLRDVCEIGSKAINGSPRKYFWFCNYIGIDLSEGKGVNIVGRLSELYNEYVLEDSKFGVVVSTECLEHDKEWEISLQIMYRVLQPGGLLLITCAAPERVEHGTEERTPQDSPDTADYYRNLSKEDFKKVLPYTLFESYTLMYGRDKQDLYFYGIKKRDEDKRLAFGRSYDEQ
jgi:SAM-dependent methyltransferase